MSSQVRAVRRRIELVEGERKPNRKLVKRGQRRATLAQWRKEKAIQDGLAAEGVFPERTLDDYHLRIAERGTTISRANIDPAGTLDEQALAAGGAS